MPTWPSTLPKLVIAGSHQMQAQPNVDAFEPDVGESIRRQRYTGNASNESFELVLTQTQVDTLRSFWATDCKQGALTFTASLVDRVARTWWFDAGSPPQFANIPGGTAYRVSLKMGCRR